MMIKLLRVFGASLSEPHTYGTAVQNPPDIYVRMHVIIIITLTSLARNFTPHEYYMILPC